MFPLVVFLSLRPSPLPSVTYLEAIQLHKWISRLVVGTGLVHSIAYLVHLIKNGKSHKIIKFKNFLGLIAMVLMLVMAIFSLKPIRRRSYKLFYYLHYPLAWAVTIIIIVHARPGVYLLAFWTIAILVAQIVYRLFTTTTTTVQTYQISPTLKEVILPRSVMPTYFSIGTHVRITSPPTKLSAWINPTHPYTIASLPEDSEVRLLVREGGFKFRNSDTISVIGQYPSIASDVYANASKVLIFAGGSGLSYGASVYRGLEMRGIKVKLVWLVRNKAEITALGLLEVSKADVYVTMGGENSKKKIQDTDSLDLELDELLDYQENDMFEGDTVLPSSPQEPKQLGHDADDFRLDGDSEEEEEEDDEYYRNIGTSVSMSNDHHTNSTLYLNETARASGSRINEHGEISSSSSIKRKNSVIDEDNENSPLNSLKGIKIYRGRPDFRLISNEYFRSDIDGEGSWVVACGPEGLVDQVETWANKYSNINFFGEKYVL